MPKQIADSIDTSPGITLFLSGDVMPGRGIDQILPHPSTPRLHEPYVVHAGDYVALAEHKSGPLAKPVDYDYIWGDALVILEQLSPDVRIINLETAITTSEDFWPGKGINYRMHPANIESLTAAGIDCCVLANNHVLDWGYQGLNDTLSALHAAGLQTCGAGASLREAETPARMKVDNQSTVLVFSFCHGSSGVPPSWGASDNHAGVARLDNLLEDTVQRISKLIEAYSRSNDIIIASVHWGGNWGYAIPHEQQQFAHQLIDKAEVDVVHGHSSHHPKGIEIYRGKPILYGCGDLLNDYEGIAGYEGYRDDLSLMYFPTLSSNSGKLMRFELVPTLIRKFRLNHPPLRDIQWLATMLNREGEQFGTSVTINDRNTLELNW